jgi:hypothetical protein
VVEKQVPLLFRSPGVGDTGKTLVDSGAGTASLRELTQRFTTAIGVDS